MTRVLFWNVNNFSANGFFPGPNNAQRALADDAAYGQPAAQQDADSRVRVLLDVIEDIEPEIISICEVKPGKEGIPTGQLVRDGAALDLLFELWTAGHFHAADNFALVPPLVSGTGKATEAIAVFYRSDLLQFLGPYGWNGVQGAPVQAGVALADYPPLWKNGLPGGTIPANWPNEGRRENQLAGQPSFADAAGAPLTFPSPNSRAPWLTTFRDIAGNRLITLLSYHAPSKLASAVDGTEELARIPAMTTPIQEREARCIVGDFNVSTFREPEAQEAFAPLRKAPNGYSLCLDPKRDGVPAELPGQGYYVTMLKGRREASPWISDRQGRTVYGYPAFDYMATGALDNALVWHGAQAGAAAGMTVCNPIAESSYRRDPAPPPGVHKGTFMVFRGMAMDVLRYRPAQGKWGIDGFEPGALTALGRFVEWDNYTHIRSTSDHLAIALDI